MIKFSIVVPCYNHFEKMEKCLKSLENQTFKDFEIIFVDDKSQDDLLERLTDYKKNSKLNMTILENKKNLGPGPSRNRGIESAVGKYITFLDADDYIAENTLEVINEVIGNENPECIIFDYFFETINKKLIHQKSYLKNESGIISKENAMIHSTGSTWCKVYLTDIIKNNEVKFPELMRSEDMVFNKFAISNCERIYYLDKPLYYYVINDKSIMNTSETLSIENSSKAVEMIEKELGEKFQSQVEAIFIKEYFYGIIVTLVKLKKSNKEILEHIEKCERKHPKLYENLVINNMTKFQRICMKLAQKRHIIILKLVVNLKEFIKKVM